MTIWYDYVQNYSKGSWYDINKSLKLARVKAIVIISWWVQVSRKKIQALFKDFFKYFSAIFKDIFSGILGVSQ